MKFILCLSLIFVSSYCFSQNPSGCIIVYPYGAVAAYPNVYLNPLIGVSVPTNEQPDIQNKPVYDGQGPSTPVNVSCYRDPSPTTKRECAIRAGLGTTASPFKWYGGVFAQDYYRCPIDDYIPFAVLGFAGLGFVLIRKQLV